MKKFVFRVFSFFVAVMILCSIPFVVFEKKAKECHDIEPYSRINEIYNMKGVNADLVVLGNSRAEGSYDATLMTNLSGLRCVNLGNGGFSFDYSYHIMYETYLKQNNPPKYIIVDIGPVAFFDHVGPVYNLGMLPYINRPEFQFYVDLCPQLSCVDKIMFVKYFGKIRKIVKEMDRLNHPEKHPIADNKKWQEDYFGKPQQLECNDTIIQLFDAFLDECLSNEIKVILVCSPMHIKDGLSYFYMNGFWNIVKKCVSGTGFPTISYAEYFDNDTAYFMDPAHLNSFGQKVFSAKLIHDLDSVGIINTKIRE